MNIAVVGATGVVGQKFLQLLKAEELPVRKLHLFASKKNQGKTLMFRSQKVALQTLSENSFRDVDIAFFSAGKAVSQKWAGVAKAKGAIVIDNSSAFRMDKNIPLVVPEINAHTMSHLKKGEGAILANPNCSTIQLVLALNPLLLHFGLEFVHVSSYQAVSGAGQGALDLLKQESLALLSGEALEKAHTLPSLPSDKQNFAFNCLPQIGEINKEGFSEEEMKIMRETKKILNQPHLNITATAVRVPVFNGHGEALVVGLTKPANEKAIKAALKTQQGLKLLDLPHIPHSRFVDTKDEVYVGRLRAQAGTGGKNWLMWVAGDNLKKGAALNGLQIAKTLIKKLK